MNLLEKFLGKHSEIEIKKLIPIVEKIESLDKKMQKLSNEELKNKTSEFKERLQNGETLDNILPEAFAVVREASSRTIGLKHFKVQLLGGIVLHQGRIAEMKTGEGKTLVATLPAYLNALTGKGVHIVTVNDYLAKRDRDLMGQIYEFLGLSVGVITQDLGHEERKKAYLCDITYGTNSEFGFDYLRDNMAKSLDETVQRELNFAIIDEVDSILIDEARTPLIIAGDNSESTKLYELADNFVRLLKKGDYEIDKKEHTIVLTDAGIRKAEEFFHLKNYSDIDNYEIQHHINQALKAHHIMRKNIDYIVKDGEVLIVDEFTGRIMDGRRFSDGLHEAIEAKEKVEIKRETKTLATITLQNYFKLYKKISGMTGTAQTEEAEFREIYGLDVVVIPTNKPVIRIDYPDVVYKTEKAKFKAVVEEIINTHKTGQPVLVGTTSIEKSEILSEMLKKRGIPHQVLNAKHHEKEAEIVSHAGEKGMVTIATNMAGRGTDIKLGEGVAELGGLKVIGTERHESRRIDNQLRGRSGRQGDPGCSRFYVSLEDELIQRFGSDRLKSFATKLGIKDDEAIESRIITKAIEDAQKRVEEQNFEIRKNLLQYDNVLNRQREIIYAERRKILQGENFSESIKQIIKDVVENIVENNIINPAKHEYNMEEIEKRIKEAFSLSAIEIVHFKGKNKEEFKQNLIKLADEIYNAISKQFKEEEFKQIEKHIILSSIDNVWTEHIDAMERFKKGIGLRALRHHDPVREYTIEGMKMFDEMIYRIKEMTLSYLFKQNPKHNETIEITVEQ